MTRRLPNRPSLSSLRKRAKKLARDFSDGHQPAIDVVERFHPRPTDFTSLRDAQFVVAREHGFADWKALKHAVELAATAPATAASLTVDEFLHLACLTYSPDDSPRRIDQAMRLLDQNPEIAHANIFTAAVVGDVADIDRFFSDDPSSVSTPGGPRMWEPLLYLCYSRIPDQSAERSTLAAARLLLDGGADPNAFFLWGDTYRFTALTGAIGEGEQGVVNQPPHQHARELAQLLLEAGADPNDGQGLYNSMFTPGVEWLTLLLEHGLAPTDMVNWKSDHPMPIMDYLLGQAVKDGQLERVRLLLDHGADPASRDFYDRKTQYENAQLSGATEIVDLLRLSGAPAVELSLPSQFEAACMRGDEAEARALLDGHPALLQDTDILPKAARRCSIIAVRLLIQLGADVDRTAEDGTTALHHAAWHDDLETVQFLVDRGASLIRERTYDATPIGWAEHAGHQRIVDFLTARTSTDSQNLDSKT